MPDCCCCSVGVASAVVLWAGFPWSCSGMPLVRSSLSVSFLRLGTERQQITRFSSLLWFCFASTRFF